MARLFRGVALQGFALLVAALLLTACRGQAGYPLWPKVPHDVHWVPADQSSAFKITTNVDIVRQAPEMAGYGRVSFRVDIESRDRTSHDPFGATVYLDQALQPYLESPDARVPGPDSSRMVFGLWRGAAGAQGPATGIGFKHDVYVLTERLDEGLLAAAKSPIRLLVWFDRGQEEYLEIPSEAIRLTVLDEPVTP